MRVWVGEANRQMTAGRAGRHWQPAGGARSVESASTLHCGGGEKDQGKVVPCSGINAHQERV